MRLEANHTSPIPPLVGTLLLILAGSLGAQRVDLTQLSIEELMNIEVTSPARKEQAIFDAGTAVSVLTGDDLRRSGVTSVAEALRLVPGVQVGRVDANKWAISARGFNDGFANKLLVLIDGRSVYTPLFSGVFWDAQDVVLEDVERIEVIRGPGGTLWGANAVNGVVNIITRKAEETQGGMVQAGAGSTETLFTTVRYGGRLDEHTHYRVYARRAARPGAEDVDGRDLDDEWHLSRVGTRLDRQLSDRDRVTLQGEVYSGEVGQTFQLTTSLVAPFKETFVEKTELGGGHALGRWKRRLGDDSDLELQLYYDRAERLGKPIGGTTETYDVDFQHRFPLTRTQEIIWGWGARFIADDFDNSFAISLNPASRSTHLFSGFVQEEIALAERRLLLTVGSKVEHNTYTGLELQPNARAVWTPAPRHLVWGAVSRAVRTPSRAESDQRFSGVVVATDTLILVATLGSRDFESEHVLAFDLGYRTQVAERLAVDLAVFYNFYDNLRTSELKSAELEETPPPLHYLVPVLTQNKLHGVTHGLEATASWQALPRWSLHAAYTYLQMDMELDEGSNDPVATTWDEENPNHQLVLRSAWDVSDRLGLDITARYMDDLPILDADSYLTLDARLGWRPVASAELFLVGQHLLDSPHLEFPRQTVVLLPGTVRRGVYGGLTWRF